MPEPKAAASAVPFQPKPALGYVLAGLTAAVTAVAWIAAKPVLDYLDPLSFSVSQFGLASVFSFTWLLIHRQTGALVHVTPRQWTFLVVVSLLFLSAVYTMWIGLSMLPATSASLLNRLEIFITVFLGMALLGDRITRRELWGALVMFGGVVVLRYEAPPGFSAGFYMMVLSSTLFGLTEVMVKARVHAIPPDVFGFVRNFLVFAFCFLAAGWRVFMKEEGFWRGLIDWDGVVRGFPLIAATALVGPFLARTIYMYSYRHLEISRIAIIKQSEPLFVAFFSSILLHTLPSRREWTGGLLILAGSLLLVSWRQSMKWIRARRAGAAGPER